MPPRALLFAFILAMLASSTIAAPSPRIWQPADGQDIEATFVKQSRDVAHLTRADGTKTKVTPLDLDLDYGYLGRDIQGGHFAGDIDDVKVYRKAYSAAELDLTSLELPQEGTKRP